MNKNWQKVFLFGAVVSAVFYLAVNFCFIFSPKEYFGKKNEQANDYSFFASGDKTVLPKNSAARIRMLFFGDLMLDRHVGEKIAEEGLDYIFEALDRAEFFKNYDLIAANLEGAVTDKGDHYPPDFSYDFAFSPALIAGLKERGFNFFNLANNHFSDQGERGIIETRKNLDDFGISYSGCPDGETGDCSSAEIKIKGKKIAMVGFSMVYSAIDRRVAAKIISELKPESDLVIVNLHGGVEYEHPESEPEREFARALIDAGADAIIGHHPHVVRGMEVYKDKPIFYSLGNFVFDQYFSSDTQEELAVSLEFNDDSLEIKLIPLKSVYSRVSPSTDKEKSGFLSRLAYWSEGDGKFKREIESGSLSIGFSR